SVLTEDDYNGLLHSVHLLRAWAAHLEAARDSQTWAILPEATRKGVEANYQTLAKRIQRFERTPEEKGSRDGLMNWAPVLETLVPHAATALSLGVMTAE